MGPTVAGHRWLRQAADPDVRPLRRVGWQLAALTVGLLSALLLVLGVAVYVTSQQLLQQSLEQLLKDRATHPPSFLVHLIQDDEQLPPGGQPPSGGQPQDSNGVFYTALDTNLTILGGTGPFTTPLSDRSQALQALQSSDYACCAEQTYGQQDYLIYSEAVVGPDGQTIGVLQASISEGQYHSSLDTLLHVLLVVSTVGLLASAAISLAVVRRALQPIRRALRRQRDFVADAAHELRTPLTIMRTAAELGLAQETVAHQQQALEQTLAQNAHLTRLVDSLSLLARADSGVVTLERQPVDLGALTTEVVSGVAILAEERDVALRLAIAPGIRVLGDAGRLRQLLLILLDNALKFTPERGTIGVRLERLPGAVRLQVQDSGPGIAPADLPHLFERFYRADRARTGEGTGLGLAIGRWIVEAHGGRIMATNAPQGGALFTVVLPPAA